MACLLVRLRTLLGFIGFVEEKSSRIIRRLQNVETQVGRLYDGVLVVNLRSFNELLHVFWLYVDMDASHDHKVSPPRRTAFVDKPLD